MNKPILIEIIACIALGVILGIAFWLFDGGRDGKTCEKMSKCLGGLPIDNDKAIKVYYGRWHKNYLEIIGR